MSAIVHHCSLTPWKIVFKTEMSAKGVTNLQQSRAGCELQSLGKLSHYFSRAGGSLFFLSEGEKPQIIIIIILSHGKGWGTELAAAPGPREAAFAMGFLHPHRYLLPCSPQPSFSTRKSDFPGPCIAALLIFLPF